MGRFHRHADGTRHEHEHEHEHEPSHDHDHGDMSGYRTGPRRLWTPYRLCSMHRRGCRQTPAPRGGEVAMCLGIPGRVVAMVEGYGDQLALVDVEGAARRVNIGLLDEGSVGPGDWVLIHMGFALERVDEEKAAQARQGLELMGRGVDRQ